MTKTFAFGLFLLNAVLVSSAVDWVEKARELVPPKTTAIAGGEYEGAEWYEQHDALLRKAWQQFGLANSSLLHFDADFIVSPLQSAIEHTAREAPNGDPKCSEAEDSLRALFSELIPGVFAANILTPEVITALRGELKHLSKSGIPSRRPNGMNRYGFILDDRIPLNDFIEHFVLQYIKPLAHVLFPELLSHGDTAEYYAFSIHYALEGDVQLKEHRDQSVVTLNINLDTNADFESSGLYFVDEHDKSHHPLAFTPGMAIIHKGAHRHAALPITAGERNNLIIWLMGKDGYVRYLPYPEHERLSCRQRWATSYDIETAPEEVMPHGHRGIPEL